MWFIIRGNVSYGYLEMRMGLIGMCFKILILIFFKNLEDEYNEERNGKYKKE